MWLSLLAAAAVLVTACGSHGTRRSDGGHDGPTSEVAPREPGTDGAGAVDLADAGGGGGELGAGDLLSEGPGPEDGPPGDAPAAPTDARDAGSDARDAAVDLLSRSPSCGRRYAYEWSAPFSTPGMPWSVAHGNPTVDAAADELLLPWDSKVYDVTVSPSATVLDFDVSIEGNLTFLVQGVPDDQAEPVPSITRAGDEMILASAQYGGAAIAPGGFFTGQRFPAQRVHVTLFLDPYAHHLGMKVDTMTQSFFSGFTKVAINPQSLTLVGDNLESERNADSRVHVGPITGCDRPFNDLCVPDVLGFCSPDGGPDAPPL
ncbi:MAG TPA: hypothetical protein VHL80_17980 [Polyangia bacterium]|nr:hypothetical protein [Polyangia bacterium]